MVTVCLTKYNVLIILYLIIHNYTYTMVIFQLCLYLSNIYFYIHSCLDILYCCLIVLELRLLGVNTILVPHSETVENQILHERGKDSINE